MRLLDRLRLRRRPATRPTVAYAPRRDGRPDPGEVVWAWVPFEDDPTQGKDRPVLLLGRQGRQFAGLMLTSKDHDHDAADEARYGRYWMDVGTGAWDRARRPSEVRLDRLLLLNPRGVRREGAALDERLFRQVVAAARRFHDLG
ncbi:type II toxin-antitoxin system PemK/MazF family toxin [Nocardioides sp.]|uniref:type II toxin-antitoxin system PemK/MazF family toxin n=1 Tax=Nocardioides sp. TaxID=35761 RepID=UPI003527CF55